MIRVTARRAGSPPSRWGLGETAEGRAFSGPCVSAESTRAHASPDGKSGRSRPGKSRVVERLGWFGVVPARRARSRNGGREWDQGRGGGRRPRPEPVPAAVAEPVAAIVSGTGDFDRGQRVLSGSRRERCSCQPQSGLALRPQDLGSSPASRRFLSPGGGRVERPAAGRTSGVEWHYRGRERGVQERDR
jgi:hypothetical protein